MIEPICPALALIKNDRAYFVKDLATARGDDWNDRPYEHNADAPYEYAAEVAFDGGDYEAPCFGHLNSPWSVDDVNARLVPWLRDWRREPKLPPIWAGTPLPEFKRLIRAAGGRVFVEETISDSSPEEARTWWERFFGPARPR